MPTDYSENEIGISYFETAESMVDFITDFFSIEENSSKGLLEYAKTHDGLAWFMPVNGSLECFFWMKWWPDITNPTAILHVVSPGWDQYCYKYNLHSTPIKRLGYCLGITRKILKKSNFPISLMSYYDKALTLSPSAIRNLDNL